MKRKITLLLAAAFATFAANAQIVLNESFTSPFNPATAGWVIQNNSVPTGTLNWFQGDGTTLPANSGGPDDYYASDYQSVLSGAGGISDFLITPTVSLVNGATFQFATISNGNYPDRMQVLMSQGTGTGAIGTGTTAVGTFTTVMADINPGLTATGYPAVWTVYTTTVSGITGTVTGRFAFRYFVSNGGPTGANSDYIGVDDVVYALPCANPTINVNPPSASICSGATATFFGSGATNYTWSAGPNTASIAVSPTATTIYTLSGSNVVGCIGTKTVAVTVTLTPNMSVPNLTTCPSTAATLQASGATTYSWNTSATTSSIVVTPASTTVYTVTGKNGTCAQTKTVSVTIGSNLSILVSSSSASVCAGSSATLTASGANTYTWLPSGSGSTIVVTPTANATYTVAGQVGSCLGANTVVVAYSALPSVSIALSSSIVCTNATSVSVTASGANTYTWSPFASNATVVTVGTPTTAGTYSLGVAGTNSAGCVNTYTTNLVVSACTGIENNSIANNATAVFPNPFTNELTISGVKGSVVIYNTLGQVVLTTTVSESETINTNSFAKGIYYIKVKSTDSNEKTIRVIKN